MKPQIDFQHVLNELSVNRNDPCELVRELISNSYDAHASVILLTPLLDENGIIFFDNGVGLDRKVAKNGITPYEAFFSIGKSTKKRGDGGIGYKCQGSKLCFACGRLLVITKGDAENTWVYKLLDNPRETLSPSSDISPTETASPWEVLKNFYSGGSAPTQTATASFDENFFKSRFASGTLIAIKKFDTDKFATHFLTASSPEETYLYNYIRHFTRHGDTRFITKKQGFKPNQIDQVSKGVSQVKLSIWNGKGFHDVPFGFHYLDVDDEQEDIKDPLEVSRLRDGRFISRSAKKVSFSGKSYSFILAVDGNKRAHERYDHLDRKGATKSGIKLADQRGLWISSAGIKICRYSELFFRSDLQDYSVLGDSEGLSHYQLIIDGDFELVTNRNALSRSSTIVLDNSAFIGEIKKFIDNVKQSDAIFKKLISRLYREQSEARLNLQYEILEESKNDMRTRERFEVSNKIHVSPRPGEEYLVGVLYAKFSDLVDAQSPYSKYWKHVLTFSTQGIDSLASEKNLSKEDLLPIEYKYSFSNSGPFNHALSLVKYIVAWEVSFEEPNKIKDQYGCYGELSVVDDGVWKISDINHEDGSTYEGHEVIVLNLRTLIAKSFPGVKYRIPPA